MDRRFVSILLGIILILAATNSVDAADLTFPINTIKLEISGKTSGIYPRAERTTIMPLGRGKSSDIECEGISDDAGVLMCLVKSCNVNDPLRNIYQVNFKSPTEFGVVSPAIINIRKCNVTPIPVIAGFMQRVLIAALIKSDQKFIFGKSSSITLAKLAEGVSDVEYSERLNTILRQPLGTFRAQKMRRIVQDASITSLRANDRDTAAVYKRLTTAHANVVFKFSADNIGVDGVKLASPGEMSTLNKNLAVVLQAPRDDGEPIGNFTKVLRNLGAAINQGVLANTELLLIENMAMETKHTM